MSSALSRGSEPADCMIARSDLPSTYSMARYMRLFARGLSTLTMCGWSSFWPMLSSRLKRSKNTTSLSNCMCGILSATGAPDSVSVALKIDAIPLRASSSPRRY